MYSLGYLYEGIIMIISIVDIVIISSSYRPKKYITDR